MPWKKSIVSDDWWKGRLNLLKYRIFVLPYRNISANMPLATTWKKFTLAVFSMASLKPRHLVVLDLARNSSINRVPMLYPLHDRPHVSNKCSSESCNTLCYSSPCHHAQSWLEYSASGEQQTVSGLRTRRKSHMESSCLLTSSGSSRSERSCRTSDPYVRVKISAFCRTNSCHTHIATNKDSIDETIIAEYCAAFTAHEHGIQKSQFITDCTVTAAHIHNRTQRSLMKYFTTAGPHTLPAEHQDLKVVMKQQDIKINIVKKELLQRMFSFKAFLFRQTCENKIKGNILCRVERTLTIVSMPAMRVSQTEGSLHTVRTPETLLSVSRTKQNLGH